ncbi:MAG: rhomboid family intramembrane serine protease [Flavobacteriia bacterium]|nr:rhomboid family intramembrane serine protease [Flavobacteriia bacterium]
MYRPQSFSILPPVIKNLIIINALFLLGTFVVGNVYNVSLSYYLAMYFPSSPFFEPWQIITHMFMHGGFEHFLFNMFALWMFGTRLENMWGGQKFLIYFIATGLGAAFLYELTNYLQFMSGAISEYTLYTTAALGASGAVFGILMAYGMLYPNELVYVYFLMPVRVKYFVAIYGAIELWMGFSRSDSGVAHFAHLGGMLFGYLLIRYWKSKGRLYH